MKNDPHRAAAEGVPNHIPSYLDALPGKSSNVEAVQ